MPLLAIFTGDVNSSQYDALRAEVRWHEQHPAGGIFHAAAFDADGGIHVADVWESGEALDAFVQQRLAPALQKLGLPAPEVSTFPTHNIDAYGTVDRFKVD
jgi:hypothetical protein